MAKGKKAVGRPFSFTIPIVGEVAPAASGDYVVEEIKEKYGIPVASTTSSTISTIAVQGAEKKMRLDEVELQLGNDTWLPLKLSFKWTKRN